VEGELTMASQKVPLKYVYDQPNRHGRTRYYFWFGRKGQRKYRVKDDIIEGGAFYQAYGRFLEGLHPYPDQEIADKAKEASKLERAIGKSIYTPGTWGSLCVDYFQSKQLKDQKNRRAIENCLRKTLEEPCDLSRPNGRKFGEMPLERLQTHEIQTLVNRWLREIEVEENDSRTGKCLKRTKTIGKSQANNLTKWISGVLKFGILTRAVKVNYARDVVKHSTADGGYKMWTDEIWNQMAAMYPLGTKPRLVFDLAVYTAQRKGDLALLGVHNMRLEEEKCPNGFLEIEQEKRHRNQEPVIAYVPILDELHESLAAARAAGILGSQFFIRQDDKDDHYSKESLGNLVRKWLRKADIPNGYSLHGLRKLCVCRLIERGCDPHDVMAVTGHQSLKEIDRYAKGYFRKQKKDTVYQKWRDAAEKVSGAA
jgi:integrase